MPPANTFHQRLCVALTDSLTLSKLQEVVTFAMNETLGNVVYTNGPFKTVVFDTVGWCRRYGRLGELVAAAANELPGRGDVQALRTEFDALQPDAPAGADLLGRFADQFAAHRSGFRHLQAYKELHDILHELDGVRQELEAHLRDGTAPKPTTINSLVNWAEAAGEWDGKADPTSPRPWVGVFAGQVKALRGPDDEAKERHANALWTIINLPAQQLSVLNIQLVTAANGLRLDDMTDLLDVRLDALRELAAAVTAFRRECVGFRALVDVHTLCQQIDTPVRAAVANPPATRRGAPWWGLVAAWLTELAALRPDDSRRAEVQQTADRFTAAGGAEAFATFADAFAGWFLGMDKKLRNAITPLVLSAGEVSDLLRNPR